MILYKYVSAKAAQDILNQNSIGFSHPHHFNDPFELEAAYPASDASNPFDLHYWAKKNIWNRNSAILSLTRRPLNSLMWSHYAESHTGCVIGINAAISEISSEDSNLVPAQFGNVIYTETRPTHDYVTTSGKPVCVGQEIRFVDVPLESLQRTFLFKPLCWSYEEEVRVVKCIAGINKAKKLPSGDFEVAEFRGRPLYVIRLPAGAIKEVYYGARHELLATTSGKVPSDLKALHPDAAWFGVDVSANTWGLEPVPLD